MQFGETMMAQDSGGGAPAATGFSLATGMPWLGTILQGIGGMQANAANERMNSVNIAHQNLWRTTAHQVAVEDMKKAGLNPILSAMSGGGAQVPGGSSAQATNAMEGMAASAMQALKMKQELDYMDAQTEKAREEANTQKVTQSKIATDAAYTSGLIGKTPREIAEINERIKDIQLGFPKKVVENAVIKKSAKAMDKINENVGNTVGWIDSAYEGVKGWVKNLIQTNAEKNQAEKSKQQIQYNKNYQKDKHEFVNEQIRNDYFNRVNKK